jgi:transcription elongation factor GreB
MRRKALPHRPDSTRSNYITAEGYRRLREEMRQLWQEERPKVTQAVSDAAALGDRSENAEYIYGKKRLRQIDGRLHFLKKRLEALTVVTPSQANAGKVYFGAWVRLESEKGTMVRYRIVGPDEIDLDRGMISMDSPLGKALMRREVGETITVQRPIGDLSYRILEVQYVPFDDMPETVELDEELVGAGEGAADADLEDVDLDEADIDLNVADLDEELDLGDLDKELGDA